MIKIAFDPIYCHPLPEGHRFPMLKYELIPGQLIHEGSFSEANFFSPKKMDEATALLAHDVEYVRKLQNLALTKQEERKTGFPLSAQLVEREFIIMQGTLDMSLAAIENGIGFNVAGGTHHAYRDRGEGFCLLNDIAISALYLLEKKLRKKSLSLTSTCIREMVPLLFLRMIRACLPFRCMAEIIIPCIRKKAISTFLCPMASATKPISNYCTNIYLHSSTPCSLTSSSINAVWTYSKRTNWEG
jgi:hypothetical protein